MKTSQATIHHMKIVMISKGFHVKAAPNPKKSDDPYEAWGVVNSNGHFDVELFSNRQDAEKFAQEVNDGIDTKMKITPEELRRALTFDISHWSYIVPQSNRTKPATIPQASISSHQRESLKRSFLKIGRMVKAAKVEGGSSFRPEWGIESDTGHCCPNQFRTEEEAQEFVNEVNAIIGIKELEKA